MKTRDDIDEMIRAAAVDLKRINPTGTDLHADQLRVAADVHDLPIRDGDDLSHDPAAVALCIAAYSPEAMQTVHYERACDAIALKFNQLSKFTA